MNKYLQLLAVILLVLSGTYECRARADNDPQLGSGTYSVTVLGMYKIFKTSECGLPNDHFGTLISVTLVLIIKNKLGSAQVSKFDRVLVKIDSSASIP